MLAFFSCLCRNTEKFKYIQLNDTCLTSRTEHAGDCHHLTVSASEVTLDRDGTEADHVGQSRAGPLRQLLAGWGCHLTTRPPPNTRCQPGGCVFASWVISHILGDVGPPPLLSTSLHLSLSAVAGQRSGELSVPRSRLGMTCRGVGREDGARSLLLFSLSSTGPAKLVSSERGRCCAGACPTVAALDGHIRWVRRTLC